MQVIDSAVLKFPKAVTYFSPGSHAYMPEQTTSFPNVFIAGDWVKNIDHGANGLSQARHLHNHPMQEGIVFSFNQSQTCDLYEENLSSETPFW